MKKVLLFLLVYFFSLSAQAEEIRFYCSSKTSNYNDLFVDLEKKIVSFVLPPALSTAALASALEQSDRVTAWTNRMVATNWSKAVTQGLGFRLDYSAVMQLEASGHN